MTNTRNMTSRSLTKARAAEDVAVQAENPFFTPPFAKTPKIDHEMTR